MVFNDDFLEEEYANLPTYQGTEILVVRRVLSVGNQPCTKTYDDLYHNLRETWLQMVLHFIKERAPQSIVPPE